jgi:hypothetical protein
MDDFTKDRFRARYKTMREDLENDASRLAERASQLHHHVVAGFSVLDDAANLHHVLATIMRRASELAAMKDTFEMLSGEQL